MNLNRVVARVIDAVNTRVLATVQISTGNVTNADGTRTPSYAAPVQVMAQVQPLSFRDIQHIQGLNLQGTTKKFYLNGEVDGLIRSVNAGGDILTLGDGSVWLVTLVAEGWNYTAGWCAVIATLQDDYPAAANT